MVALCAIYAIQKMIAVLASSQLWNGGGFLFLFFFPLALVICFIPV